MLTKEEMKQVMIQMETYLKTFGLSDDEILGAINVAKIEAILNGTYKNENSKESK